MGIKQPHVVVVPLPAQGHVMPLMKLSQRLVDEGFKITFVNMEFIHKKIMDSLISLNPAETNKDSCRNNYYYGDVGNCGGQIRMVTVPDGLTPEQQKDGAMLFTAIRERFPDEFERLMKNIINEEEESAGTISCVIADESMSCALEVARKMGIRRAAFNPAAAAIKALARSIPALIQNGVIDDNGTPKRNEKIFLSPTMPAMDTAHLVWYCMGSLQQIVFQSIIKNDQISSSADWMLCNSSTELESGAFSFVPNLLPIGPLITLEGEIDQLGSLWPEDPTCFHWLDQQATNSVIYVSFGSTSIFNQAQLNELALGLELLGRPFLWVVREDFTENTEISTTYPDGFQDRIACYGKIVCWAPQQKLLSHPSVACFMSHCGWNSIMEGLSMGVPFICWPYFADQFLNRSYITDVWKVGLGLDPDENGIISRYEIKKKVEKLLGDDEGIRERAQKLKESATGKDGSSSKNFDQFVKAIKELSGS